MPMFPKVIDCPPVGRLQGEGRSSVWEGQLDIPSLSGRFHLRIHGEATGPTAAQTQALGLLLRHAPALRAEATGPLCDFLLDSGVVPVAERAALPGALWGLLSPCFIEVHADEGPGGVDISVGFEIPWDGEHLLQLMTTDGLFKGVSSE